MNKLLTTYWIVFGETLAFQYGVTAYSLDDAIHLLRQRVFGKQQMPSIISFKEDIKFADLDQNHVVPNMGPIAERGVWFPGSFSF